MNESHETTASGDTAKQGEKWISVKDKLPKQGIEVLVFWKDHKKKKHKSIGTLWKYDNDWHFKYYDVDGPNDLDDSQVTHWMSLPQNP